MPLKATRRLLDAALSGEFDGQPMAKDPIFGLSMPIMCDGVDAQMLDPRRAWSDKLAYDQMAGKVAGLFAESFRQFEAHVSEEVLGAAILNIAA